MTIFSSCLKIWWSLFGRLSIGDAFSLQYLSRVELAESTEMTPQQGNKIIFVLFLLQLHFHSTNQMNFRKSCMHPLLILSQLTKLYSPQFPSSSGSMSKLSNHWLSSQTLLWHSYFSSFKSKFTSKLLWNSLSNLNFIENLCLFFSIF